MSNNFSLNVLSNDKQKVENKNVIKIDSINVLYASCVFLGSIMAVSYLQLAIPPRIVHILIYNPYNPKSSGLKYCVKIGVINIGTN